MHDDYVQTQTALGLEVPKNQRRHKYLGRAVFEYVYASIGTENEKLGDKAKVDTCRGIYVRPGGKGRLWDASWVEHDTFVQLLVRNRDCILGTWLVEPIEDENHGDEQEESGAGGTADFASGEGIPAHDDLGAGEALGESGTREQGSG